MSNQKRLLQTLETTKPNTFVEVSVYYDLGGWDWWNGCNQPRGYWLDSLVVEKDGHFRSFMLGIGGCKMFLEEATRFSQKKLNSLAPSQEDIDKVVNYAISKNNVELV